MWWIKMFHRLLVFGVVVGVSRVGFGQSIFDHLPTTPTDGATNSPTGSSAGTTSTSPTAQLKLNCPAKFILSLCQDLQGNIWAGSENEGIWRIDPRTGKSTRFTTKNGLGDPSGYSIGCDRKGRIWIGHLNHGVSVFNGSKFQNYEVVGGLSRPDTLSGPLGERVFHIAVNPKDGDVWIATSLGLARYSDSEDKWLYYTRSDGMSSDQASSLAFGSDGTIYVATQCNGIDIAEPKYSYKVWRHCTAPAALPVIPRGNGLPTNLINDVLVTSDGTVFAATDAGLAWSRTRGRTWEFVRGADWADKVRGLTGGPRREWLGAKTETLAEDCCTCLADDHHGNVWVGHRDKNPELMSLATGVFVRDSAAVKPYARSILPVDQELFIGCYGEGLIHEGENPETRIAAAISPGSIPRLPSGAAPPLAVESANPPTQRPTPTARSTEYLADDWTTEGDWVGRYGAEHAMLCSVMAPTGDQELSLQWTCSVQGQIGPNHAKGDSLRHWISRVKTDDQRSLYDPALGIRRQAEWDDHGEAYDRAREGPDIYVSVRLPEGMHRISLYFMNKDGNSGGNRFRDYLVEIRAAAGSLLPPLASPPLASSRVVDFRGGIYKQFVASGPADYVIRISRNYSLNTICSGIFVDGWPAPPKSPPGLTYSYMADVKYGPQFAADPSKGRQPARSTPVGVPTVIEDHSAPPDRGAQILSYRQMLEMGAPQSVLAQRRWNLHLWTGDDRKQFQAVMAAAWSRMQEFNPVLRDPHWRPYSPGVASAATEGNAP